MRASAVVLAILLSLPPLIVATSAPDVDRMPIGKMHARMVEDPRFAAYVEDFLREHGADHPRRDPSLAGADPVAAARAILHEDVVRGRTPAEWIAFARVENLLSSQPTGAADLAAAYRRLAAEAGRPATDREVAAFASSAKTLSPEAHDALAGLILAAADTIASQRPIGDALGARRLARGDGYSSAMTEEERSASLDAAMAIMARANHFAQIVAAGPAIHTRIGDPQGLIVIGTEGDDVHEGARPAVLLVDPAGNDRYAGAIAAACAAGSSCPIETRGFPGLSIAIDLGGDDAYDSKVGVSQAGAQLGGIAILVDHAGDDTYAIEASRAVGQAGVEAATAILVDVEGDDRYELTATPAKTTYILGQGSAYIGGTAIVSDAAGDDEWLSTTISGGLRGGNYMYVNAAGLHGVAILLDAGGGDDAYHAWIEGDYADYYSQGFGVQGGLGIMVDEGGDDDYSAVENVLRPGALPILSCAFGTATVGGVGIFIETGGNDRYFGRTTAPGRAYTLNEGYGGPGTAAGLFIDVSGDDGHFMEAEGGEYAETLGRGVLVAASDAARLSGAPYGFNTAGLYLDLGGKDAYTGAPPSGDGRAWVAGADVELVIDLGLR